MPTLPPGRLTWGDIRRFAMAKAGNRAVITDANLYLSQLLYQLYTDWAWPFLMVTVPMTINGPTFTLPTDFLQAQDDNSLQVMTWDGQNIALPMAFILEKDPATFYATQQVNTSGGMPRIWMADRNAGVGRVFPDPTGHSLVVTFRYKMLPFAETIPAPLSTPLANDAIVPTFPYHGYLVAALAAMIMDYEADPRAALAVQMADALLARIRSNAMPLRSQEPVIPLDPEIFGAPFTED